MNTPRIFLTSLLALAASVPLSATNIHFGPAGPDFDNDYDTGDLDFTAGRGTSPGGDPFFWGGGYNDLPNAVYSGVGDTLLFDLVPLGGKQVRLDSFAMGDYLGRGGQTGYSVYDLSDLGTPLVQSFFDIFYDVSNHPTFPIGLTSGKGLRLVVHADVYNNGVNDIQYTIKTPGTGVPDGGATAGLLGLSAAALALLRRKS
jgi:VPDSG-CTERM motif